MTYRVRFEGYALHQLRGLPGEAFDALLARVLELVEAPWDAAVMPPGDDPAYRRAVFGSRWGLLTFHVEDERRGLRAGHTAARVVDVGRRLAVHGFAFRLPGPACHGPGGGTLLAGGGLRCRCFVLRRSRSAARAWW